MKEGLAGFCSVLYRVYLKLVFSIININLAGSTEEFFSNILFLPLLNNKLSRLRADKRIGPHNKIVLDLIFGSLLGDGHAERRIKGNGTRITFYQEGVHVSYLL